MARTGNFLEVLTRRNKMLEWLVVPLKQIWFILVIVLAWAFKIERNINSLKKDNEHAKEAVSSVVKDVHNVSSTLNDIKTNQEVLIARHEDDRETLKRALDAIDESRKRIDKKKDL